MKMNFKAMFSAVMNKARIIVQETNKVVELSNVQSTSFEDIPPLYSATLFIDAYRGSAMRSLGTITQEVQVIVGGIATKSLPSSSDSVQVIIGQGKNLKLPSVTDTVEVKIQ